MIRTHLDTTNFWAPLHEEEDDNKISSIFLVLKSSNEKLDRIEVDLTSRKIQITLREKEYGTYDNLKNNDNLNNIFFSFFIIFFDYNYLFN